MVFPISTWAPEVPAVTDGALLSELSDPQPVRADAGRLRDPMALTSPR